MTTKLKRRDIHVSIIVEGDQRHIQVGNPTYKVRMAIESAMKVTGITDGKTFMAGLTATAMRTVNLQGKSEAEIKRLIGKSVAESLNDTNGIA